MKSSLEQMKGKKSQIENDIKEHKINVEDNIEKQAQHEQAREIIREVGMKTQQQLQYHISDITSLALEAVFPNPYKLEMEFIQRRNKTECDIFFSRDGKQIDPLSASGGGAVDIASFALRIASWSLQKPNKRNTIILDEPMKYVSEEYVDKASLMIKEVGKKLGIQFVIITHEPRLAAFADRTFQTNIKKRRVNGAKWDMSRIRQI